MKFILNTFFVDFFKQLLDEILGKVKPISLFNRTTILTSKLIYLIGNDKVDLKGVKIIRDTVKRSNPIVCSNTDIIPIP